MAFRIPILIQFDKIEPAYDLAFDPSIITFRMHEKLRWPGEPGESHFYVWDGGLVQCHDVACPDLENEFVLIPNDYKRLQEMYWNGLKEKRAKSFGGL